MSHFSEVKVEVKDVDELEKVLKAKGFTTERDAVYRGWNGQTREKAALVVKGQRGDVGFVRQPDGTHAMVGDDMMLGSEKTGTLDRFRLQFMQPYARAVALKRLRTVGYTSVREEQDQKTGAIKLRLRAF